MPKQSDRMSSALRLLAAKIEYGCEAGLLPSEWRELVQAALAEVQAAWLTERAFRFRTGSSAKWCRAHFDECRQAGLARQDNKGHRQWHMHARLPRTNAQDPEAVKQEIIDSYRQGAA
jgi:hypothetical protein